MCAGARPAGTDPSKSRPQFPRPALPPEKTPSCSHAFLHTHEDSFLQISPEYTCARSEGTVCPPSRPPCGAPLGKEAALDPRQALQRIGLLLQPSSGICLIFCTKKRGIIPPENGWNQRAVRLFSQRYLPFRRIYSQIIHNCKKPLNKLKLVVYNSPAGK